MLKYAQEEYGFRLSLKNVVLPKAERNQVEKISDTEQKKLVSYLKANMPLTAFGILLSLFMGQLVSPVMQVTNDTYGADRKFLSTNSSSKTA